MDISDWVVGGSSKEGEFKVSTVQSQPDSLKTVICRCQFPVNEPEFDAIYTLGMLIVHTYDLERPSFPKHAVRVSIFLVFNEQSHMKVMLFTY